eukprot:135345-Chlamydomonas_euryale.AAC.2
MAVVIAGQTFLAPARPWTRACMHKMRTCVIQPEACLLYAVAIAAAEAVVVGQRRFCRVTIVAAVLSLGRKQNLIPLVPRWQEGGPHLASLHALTGMEGPHAFVQPDLFAQLRLRHPRGYLPAMASAHALTT